MKTARAVKAQADLSRDSARGHAYEVGGGGGTRTLNLQVMSLTSCRLLHPDTRSLAPCEISGKRLAQIKAGGLLLGGEGFKLGLKLRAQSFE